MRSTPSLLLCAALGLYGCRTPPAEPSLLDREFEAYRLDRDERRAGDLKDRAAKARAEAERLEAELASLLRRIREARARTDEANAEIERLAAAPPTPARVAGPAAAPTIPGALPPPVHRTPAAPPK